MPTFDPRLYGARWTGVDISPEMLAKLREKSSAVTVVEDDMTTVSLGREFAVAFIAFNSIFILDTQEKQVELFRNAARHLRPGGRFVLETAVVRPPSPDPESGRHCTHFELDLMAQLAGLVREDRWGDWKGTPFGPKSELHVSIYRKP